MNDKDALATMRKLLKMIADAPESSGGEFRWHKDGSTTENRWTARTK